MTGRLLALGATGVVLALAGCGGGGGGQTTTESAPPLYRYDTSAPLGYTDKGVVLASTPIKVHDISYVSPRGGQVAGYLTVPPGKGPFPAVIFLHGSGGSRRNFVAEASWLSARNVVGLTIDSPFARQPQTLAGMAGVRQQRNLEVQAVLDVRRAVDVLKSLKNVDANRIGVLGYDTGATTAAIAAGVDPRIKAAAIVSGGQRPVAAYTVTAPAKYRKAIDALLTSVDPTTYVGRAKGKFLFQTGRADEVLSQNDLNALANAAPKGAEVKRYDAGHELVTNGSAIKDELDWLAKQLGAKGTVPGALTGPVNG